jgi:hypothetical protein
MGQAHNSTHMTRHCSGFFVACLLTPEMILFYRQICIATAPIAYEMAGTSPQVVSDGCDKTAVAYYNQSSEAFTCCYERLGGMANPIAWGRCLNDYAVPTLSKWPLNDILPTRGGEMFSITPIYASTYEPIVFPTVVFPIINFN